jgi:hypothetical protein
MTVYVIRDGVLVLKDGSRPRGEPGGSLLPAPHVSRLEPFESPVSGREISSWRERDREMRAVDAYDPRDLRRDHVYRRGRQVQFEEAKNGRSGSEPIWTGRP